MRNRKKKTAIFLMMLLLATAIMGCTAEDSEKENTDLSAGNVIITETRRIQKLGKRDN